MSNDEKVILSKCHYDAILSKAYGAFMSVLLVYERAEGQNKIQMEKIVKMIQSVHDDLGSVSNVETLSISKNCSDIGLAAGNSAANVSLSRSTRDALRALNFSEDDPRS